MIKKNKYTLLGLGAFSAILISYAAWSLWDYGTPEVIELDRGVLAGYTIGQTKDQLLKYQDSGEVHFYPVDVEVSNSKDKAVLRKLLLTSNTWDVSSPKFAEECPDNKQCPGVEFRFLESSLASIQVKCWVCP